MGKGEAIKQIIADFEKAGYLTELHLVNMADYGVPETRQRVIIIGQRKNIGNAMVFHFPEPTHDKNGAEGRQTWKSIREAIGHFPNPDEPNDVMNHEYSKYKVEYRDYTAHRPTNPDKPSPTILARGNGGGGVCAIPHYNGERRLTVRESASVQTFPEDFFFCGVRGSCYRQIGNAVPVLFAKILGAELMRIQEEEMI